MTSFRPAFDPIWDRRFDGTAELIRELGERMDTRFDTQGARLERHAGLFQTGNRWIARKRPTTATLRDAMEPKHVWEERE